MNRRRILGTVALAALVVWLICDRPTRTRRITALNAAIAARRLPPLDSATSSDLRRTVEWLANSAGFDDSVAVNQPWNTDTGGRHVLHVFVTTPDMEAVTSCGPKNAVYDAELDAVFIDESLIYPRDWAEYLATPDGGWGLDIPLQLRDIPSLRVYVRLVLLHELGHRRLHRAHASTALVWTPEQNKAAIQREVEADSFAVSRMRFALATASRFGLRSVEEYTGNLIDYPVTTANTVEDQAAAALIEMATTMSAGHMALPSTGSPWQETTSHPSYLVRSRGLIAQLLRDSNVSARLRAMAAYAQAQLDRMAVTAAAHPAELTSNMPLTDALFDARGLVLVGAHLRDSTRLLYRSSYADMKRASANDHPVVLATEAETLRTTVRDLPRVLWTAGGDGVIGMDSAGRQRIVAPTFDQLSTANVNVRVPRHGFARLLSAATPSEHAFALGITDDSSIWLHAFIDGKLTKSMSATDLLSAWRSRVPPGTKIDWPQANSGDQSVFAPILTSGPTGNSSLTGMLEIDPRELRVRALHWLQLPAPARAYSTTANPLIDPDYGRRQVACGAGRHGMRCVLIEADRTLSGGDMPPGRSWRLRLWEIYDDRPPRGIAERSFLVAMLNGALTDEAARDPSRTPRVLATAITWLDDDRLIINIDGDCVYALNVRTDQLRVLFYPGGERLRVVPSTRGLVAIFLLPTYRAYVFDVRN